MQFEGNLKIFFFSFLKKKNHRTRILHFWEKKRFILKRSKGAFVRSYSCFFYDMCLLHTRVLFLFLANTYILFFFYLSITLVLIKSFNFSVSHICNVMQ
jgi:hypothetical protein